MPGVKRSRSSRHLTQGEDSVAPEPNPDFGRVLEQRELLEVTIKTYLRDTMDPDGNARLLQVVKKNVNWLKRFISEQSTTAPMRPIGQAPLTPPTTPSRKRKRLPSPGAPTVMANYQDEPIILLDDGNRDDINAMANIQAEPMEPLVHGSPNDFGALNDGAVSSEPINESEQLCYKLLKTTAFTVDATLMALLECKEGKCTFIDRDLLIPSGDGTVQGMLKYAGHLEKRGREDGLRKAMVAYAIFERCEEHHGSDDNEHRLTRWDDEHYASFFRRHEISGKYEENKITCQKQREFGGRLHLYCRQLGFSFIPFLVSHDITEHQLRKAPKSGVNKDNIVQHISKLQRRLKKSGDPLVGDCNDRVWQLICWINGKDAPTF